MRTIKFRAYDRAVKRIVDWSDIVSKVSLMNNVFYSNNLILMQFTGLKDSKGVEIYEFMELDNKYEVIYVAPKYVLRNISNGDIIDLYDNKYTITKEYTKI